MIHIDHTHCFGCDNDKGQREVSWQARCECGWEAPARPAGDASLAHRDYREHVEAELGAAAYYDAPAACRNCGSEHVQGVVVGMQVTSAACSRCGAAMLSPRNDAWDDSRRNAARWSL